MMLDRCYNPNNSWYHLYGGRGIGVCPEWRGKQGFQNFVAYMGERPPGMTIDRFPDGDADYGPGNCRWATPHEQNLNRSCTKLTEDLVQKIHGRHEHGESQASIARRMNVKPCHISQILSGAKWKSSKEGYK
jgi:hypothetical protein